MKLDHPSIIRAFDFYESRVPRDYCSGIVMELGKMSLFDIFRKVWQVRHDESAPVVISYIKESEMKGYMRDVSLGLQYLVDITRRLNE